MHVCKLHSVAGPVVVLKREEGKERQFREKCKNCGLLLLYRMQRESPEVYLVDGSFVKSKDPLENAVRNLVGSFKTGLYLRSSAPRGHCLILGGHDISRGCR